MLLTEKLKSPRQLLISLSIRGFFNWMADETYLKMLYWCYMGKKLNLRQPKTFNEKLQWLKIYYRKHEYSQMVDKYEAKKHVANIIGNQYIIPTLGVWDHFEDINFNELPHQFVLKCTHDSGGLVICRDKSQLDINAARKKINKSLKRNFYNIGREWPYKNVKPRIIAEKYMVDESGEELKDYKIMCFHGEPKCSFVCSNRNISKLCVNFFDLKWDNLPFKRHYPRNINEIKKPVSYEKMLELAKQLSKSLTFARIDFYEVYEKIYFGEITFFPGNGMEEFTPEEWDYKLGSWIELPERVCDCDS